jgi:signal transduction histidine kinase
MDRLGSVARRYALEILTALIVVESAVEVAFRHHPPHPGLASFDVLAIALVNAPLLARRRFPFLAPAALWLLAAVASAVDGLLVVTSAGSFLSGMIASFLLGNLPSRSQARIGLAIVACAGLVLIYDKPGHAEAELVFYPVLFVLVWGAGMALRERGRHAEEAERRAVRAEHQREAAAHAAVAQERARIARELHDTTAHAVSVMVLQVGAVRIKLPDAHHEHKNVLLDVERAGRTALADMRHLLDAMREDGQDVSGWTASAGCWMRSSGPGCPCCCPSLVTRSRCRAESTFPPTGSSRRASPTCSSTPMPRKRRSRCATSPISWTSRYAITGVAPRPAAAPKTMAIIPATG